jgi:hypothetical protein
MQTESEYSVGLEKVFSRNSIFLIDTSVFLGDASGTNHLEDEIDRMVFNSEYKRKKFERIEAAYNIISNHHNVRLTIEVYNELKSIFGGLRSKNDMSKRKLRIAETINNYLENHKSELLINSDYWIKNKNFPTGLIIRQETLKQYPDLSGLSGADISILLCALENIVGSDYRRMDIVTCDFGILVGTKLVFDVFDYLPIEKEVSKKEIRKRCMKVVSRRFNEDYQDFFNSHTYSVQLWKGRL